MAETIKLKSEFNTVGTQIKIERVPLLIAQSIEITLTVPLTVSNIFLPFNPVILLSLLSQAINTEFVVTFLIKH